MTDEPIIRLVKESDLKDLVHLCKLHATYEKAEYDASDKESKLQEHLFSENPSLFCLVVEKDKKLIGYAAFMKQFSTWDVDFYIYMDCLFLSEDCRGLGIGKKMIDSIKAQGLKMNCHLIQWQTPEINTRAMKFYERLGASSKSKERYFLKL